jgi:hypothetical protein
MVRFRLGYLRWCSDWKFNIKLNSTTSICIYFVGDNPTLLHKNNRLTRKPLLSKKSRSPAGICGRTGKELPQQAADIFEQISFVVAVVLGEALRAKAMQARLAPVVLWT